jgi:hypothetical protein
MYNLLLSSVFVEGPEPNPIVILFEELPDKNFPAFWPKAILFDPNGLLNKAARSYCCVVVSYCVTS